MKNSISYDESVQPANGSKKSLPTDQKTQSSQPSSEQPPTATRKKISSNSKSSSGRRTQKSRRDVLLLRLGVTEDVLAASPKITPILRQNGIKIESLVQTLRCDSDPQSLGFVRLWDSLSPASRSIAGIEVVAVAAGFSPRRLWELYQGARLVQSRESVGMLIADALPDVFKVTIKNAKKDKGTWDREHLYKISGSLPTPKGSTTTINLGQPQSAELKEGEEESGKYLERADDFYLRASKAMNPKQRPPAKAEEIMEAETES